MKYLPVICLIIWKSMWSFIFFALGVKLSALALNYIGWGI